MLKIIPGEVSQPKLHEYLLSCVAPRPIAFVSTIDKNGKVNLAPFSFFNVFGSNPPVVVFSPAVNGRTGKTKHTLENLKEIGECVINIVSFDIIHQCNLASAEFEKGIDEFVKAGLNKIESFFVKPPRLAESKAQLECKVLQIIPTGTGGGAGNLVVCEVLALHVSEDVLDENGSVSPFKFQQVARMGKNFWARMIPEAIIEMPRMPDATKVIGFDGLPDFIRHSKYLTGNDIALLANNESLPNESFHSLSKEEIEVKCKDEIAKGNLFKALCIAFFLQ
jgi:flavin reductase (DIM6/NTAB) family NADH-FMN oxidoreductase RutF